MERRHPRYWLVEKKEKSSHTHLYVLASMLLASVVVLFWKVCADRQIAYEVRSKEEESTKVKATGKHQSLRQDHAVV